MMEIVLGAVILWIIPVFVAASIGSRKHRAGLFYGLFLGWLGVIIVALLPPNINRAAFRECPHCKEQMRVDASVCPHCQRDVEALPAVSLTPQHRSGRLTRT